MQRSPHASTENNIPGDATQPTTRLSKSAG
jgi:hypothetical protein